MALCEKCGSKGFDPRQMGATDGLLVGPCCHGGTAPLQTDKLQYGIELSSSYGFVAYVQYEGLSLEYRKRPEELLRKN